MHTTGIYTTHTKSLWSRRSYLLGLLSVPCFLDIWQIGPVGSTIIFGCFGCFVYAIGVILQTVASTIDLLTAGRAIAGVGVGVGFESAAIIMYISEITPKSIRGTVTSAYQFAITLGLLIAAIVNYATKDILNAGAYRIPISLQFIWAAILAGGLLFLSESPRWYVMKDKAEKAKEAISRIRRQSLDSAYVQNEYEELYQIWQEEKGLSAGWLACFSGGFKRGSNLHRTLIGTAIQMMQQLSKSKSHSD